MKRRQFAFTAAAALAALSQLPARAQGEQFKSGTDYLTLDTPVPVDAKPPQVQVIEFFSYICPFCKQAEPALEAWKKKAPKDVAFERVHVGWDMDGKPGAPLQRIYYALDAMGKADDAMQTKVFTALQTEGKALDQPQTLFGWIAQQGIDRAQFEAAYNSFGVATRVKQAAQLTTDYGVTGTPSLAVGGRYFVDGNMGKSFDRMLLIIDALVARERQRMKG